MQYFQHSKFRCTSLTLYIYIVEPTLKYSVFDSIHNVPVKPIAERAPPVDEYLTSDDDESAEEDERYDHEYKTT